jgi:hypothetical protein
LEKTVKDISAVKIPTPAIQTDAVAGPLAFPPLDPLPTGVVDSGKIRMGVWTPPFPAPRRK